MSIQYHDQPNTVTVATDRSTVENTDQPATVDVSTTETTVTVVSGVGAIGPQGPTGPEGPQGPPGAVASLTVSSPLASTGGSSPNLSLGVVPVTYGGTGVGSLTGYVYGNGTSAFSASTSIPNSAVTGLGTMALQNANSIAVTGGYLSDVSEEVNCSNRTGTAIAKGSAVYLIGAHGDVPEIALADASGESTAARTLGIAVESIPDAGVGRVCFSGLLTGINTQSLTEGALVWLSETAGELTSTRPTQPAHGVFMGVCVKQAPGGAGRLFVSVSNGQELDELHDVLITSPTAGQLFKRNTGNTLWVNASPASLTATNDTNVTLTLGGNASTALVNDASLTLGWTGTLAATRLNTNVVQAVSNDTNVTGSINSQALTLGWTGVLAGTRLNSAVVQSVSNDTNVTGSINSQALALGWTGTLASSRLNANVVQTVTSDTNVTGSINSQAMTLGWTGQLSVGRGGTGASSLSGYLVGNGGSAFTAVSSIPGSAISGNITGNAANVTGIVAVTNGGTGIGSLTGLVKGNGTSAFTAATSGVDYAPATTGTAILYGDGSGGFSAVSIGSNLTFTGGTLSATGGGGGGITAVTATSPLASSGGATPDISFTGILPVSNGGSGVGSLTGYLVGNGSSAFTAVSSIPNTAISGLGTMSTQNANNVAITGGSATSLTRVTVAAGTAAVPSIAAQANDDCGVFFPGSSQICFTTAGVQRIRIDATGRVGIGTSLLQAPFHVARASTGVIAQFRLESLTINPGLRIEADETNNTVGLNPNYSGAVSPHLTFKTQEIERLRITSGGDLAIGAAAKLYVDGTDATGDTYLHESSANNLSFVTGGTERLRLTSSGDTAIPATAKLYLDGVGGTGDTYLQEVSGNNIAAVTGGTERVRITGNGRVLINTSTEHMAIPLNVIRGAGVVNFSDAVAPEIYIRRARSTASSPTALQTNDTIGSIIFQGYGGANNRSLASISPVLTTYTSDTDMTAALRFYTTNAGTANVERFRISGPGDIAIGSGAKLLLDSVGAAGDTYLTEASANNIAIFTGGAERVRIDGSGNVGVATATFGSSAANVFAVKNGTEPTSGPADTVQIYSVDRSAGNTIPAIYCEGTGVTNAGITSTTVTHKIALKVNGTVYYLLATTNAT